MAEEGMVGNVKKKNEKRIKAKSKKDKMIDDSDMPLEEVQKMKAIESVRIFEKEDISDVTRDCGRGQKKNKNKETGGAKADVNEDLSKSKLTELNGKKKMKKKSPKNENEKDAEFESNTEEAKGNEIEKWLEGESVSGKGSYKEIDKESKKQKVKTNNEDVDLQEGEKDGEVMGTDSEDCEIIATEIISRKKNKREKKKKKHGNVIWPQGTFNEAKPDKGDLSALQQENLLENVGGDVQATMADVNATKESERKKKKHKKKENYRDDSSSAQQESVDNDCSLTPAEQRENDEGQRNKKRTKFVEKGSHDGQDNENSDRRKKRKAMLVENRPGDATPTPAKSNKKVRFSGEVEVFTLPDDSNTEKGNDEDYNLVRGKRFSPEEDEILKDAGLKYIEERELGDEGLDMLLHSMKYPELRGCWKEIGAALPHRPFKATYYRLRVLFMRSETRKWTQEEYDIILKHHAVHGGSQWRMLADKLGKHPMHVMDAYRRIKLPNLRKGKWSQEEYQKLFNLVNTDLQLKISEDKKSRHGMLRDNISWSAISDELSTRDKTACCRKWYGELTSPMVAEGVWADSDDYRMVSALYSLDATCVEDVEWDDLVENRSGHICRKRWNQMVRHTGQHGSKSFGEQVEVLAQRYCPHLLEFREIWDSKPRVP